MRHHLLLLAAPIVLFVASACAPAAAPVTAVPFVTATVPPVVAIERESHAT